MFPKRVYRCPCLMTFINEMGNLMINDINGNLLFLKEIENTKYLFSKIFCVKLSNQMDLMILCKNHLNVSILANSKYNCSADDGRVLIEKMNKCLC